MSINLNHLIAPVGLFNDLYNQGSPTLVYMWQPVVSKYGVTRGLKP